MSSLAPAAWESLCCEAPSHPAKRRAGGQAAKSSCPRISQVLQSGVERRYLCCQARDELCPTTGLYLMERSRNSSRFKSRHQEMDNASYLDMPQTTAGMHPLARQEQAARSGLGAAWSTLQTQPPAEAALQPQQTQPLP